MQIIIDTEREKIDAVLRVLSAAYGVEVTLAGTGGSSGADLAAAPAAEAAASAAAPSRGRRGGRRAAASAPEGGRARRPRGRASSASTAQIRAWAREQGQDVPARGRLSAEVIAAYEEAHR
ncbi:MAG: Lsr2 family DNA-binding protein [Motilibacteraceae bacterium]